MSSFSLGKAAAKATKAAMGLLFPILCNSRRTALASVSGVMLPSFAAMTFKASMTSLLYFTLTTKSAAAYTLWSLSNYSYSSRILSWLVLFSISAVN